MQGNFTISSPSIPGQLEVTFEEKDGASVITFDIFVLGAKAAAIELSGKEVAYEDFSTPPEGNIHTDGDEFDKTCDYDSFVDHMKQTLGDEIYTLIQTYPLSVDDEGYSTDSDYDDDYNYDDLQLDDDYNYNDDYNEN